MIRLLFFWLLLASCTNQSAPTTTSHTDTSKPAQTNTVAGEQLLGLQLNADSQTVVITVMSNGCTTKKDFRFTMENGALLIERTRRDDCKRMPFATALSFSYAEVGIKQGNAFRIRNGFSATFFN
jgi:hypothetical protein